MRPRRCAQRGSTVRSGELEQLDLPEASFDVVSSMEVVEHVPDVNALLRECRRLLRPGGALYLTTPHGRGISARLLGTELERRRPAGAPPALLHPGPSRGARPRRLRRPQPAHRRGQSDRAAAGGAPPRPCHPAPSDAAGRTGRERLPAQRVAVIEPRRVGRKGGGERRPQRHPARRHPQAGRRATVLNSYSFPAMERLDTQLDGPILVRPVVHGDERGFFHESYRRSSIRRARHPRGVRAGQPFALAARDRPGDAFPGRRRDGEAGALRPGGDRRRGGRPPQGLADVRALGGVRAQRREPSPAVLPGRLRARLLRDQ